MTFLEIFTAILVVGFCSLLLFYLMEIRWWIFRAPHVEAAIITTLGRVDWIQGRPLRLLLEEQGYRLGCSRFYTFMSYLVDAGCVEIRFEPNPDNEDLPVGWYKLIRGGRKQKTFNPFKLGIQSLLPHPVMYLAPT